MLNFFWDRCREHYANKVFLLCRSWFHWMPFVIDRKERIKAAFIIALKNSLYQNSFSISSVKASFRLIIRRPRCDWMEETFMDTFDNRSKTIRAPQKLALCFIKIHKNGHLGWYARLIMKGKLMLRKLAQTKRWESIQETTRQLNRNWFWAQIFTVTPNDTIEG